MRRLGSVKQRLGFFAAVAVVATLLLAVPLLAEVQVTLKSGANLVGKVSIEGKEVVVKLEDSELRVPLDEVDSVTSADSGPERQAKRLLLTALESRVAKNEGAEVIGLLAEASRLTPDDPHIAYWYAESLADAGYGQAASDIFTKHREAIGRSYPGLVNQLAKRIERRVEMERLPPALIERLDALNVELSRQSSNADKRQFAEMFRLVDQDKQPLDRSVFQLQGYQGQEDNIEVYDDGYFLHTYSRHRSNEVKPSKLEVLQPGLEQKTFELQTSPSKVRDAGELVVKRYGDDAKRPIRFQVRKPDKSPLLGAEILVSATGTNGSQTSSNESAQTDVEGVGEVGVFPMRYSYSVKADGYNPVSGSIDVRADGSDPKPIELVIHPAIRGTVQLEWESALMQGGGKTTGEATVEVGGPNPHQNVGANETSWLRPFQQGDELRLQFVDNFFGGYHGPFGQAAGGWVRVLEGDEKKPAAAKPENQATNTEAAPAEQSDAAKQDDAAKPAVEAAAEPSAEERFKALEFDSLEDLKKKLRQPKMLDGGVRNGPAQPLVVRAEKGKIYVGQLQHRDPRTGQPVQLSFKAYVEDLGKAEE